MGLSRQEAAIYVSLLRGPRSTSEIATDLGKSAASVTKGLGELTRRGLINRLPGRTTRFALVPPDWVLPTLIQHKEEEIHDLRRSATELSEVFQRSYEKSPLHPYLEVYAGPEAVLAQISQLLESTTEESVTFVKSPILSPEAPGIRTSLSRGARARSLWEREVLEAPGMLAAAHEWVAAGEDVRVVQSLPSKLLIFDRKTALINVTEFDQGRPFVAGLLTRHPELVATLYRLFEVLWQTAVPILAGDKSREGRVEDRDRLVSCLQAGMTDAAIQRVLGMSRRTFSRRLAELIEDVGGATRFQAGFKLGFQASRHGDRT